jgi:hypothetical protein
MTNVPFLVVPTLQMVGFLRDPGEVTPNILYSFSSCSDAKKKAEAMKMTQLTTLEKALESSSLCFNFYLTYCTHHSSLL